MSSQSKIIAFPVNNHSDLSVLSHQETPDLLSPQAVTLKMVVSESAGQDKKQNHSYLSVGANFNAAKPHYSLGKALAKKGEWNKAISSYRKALGLDSNSAEIYHNFGDALVKNCEFDEAVIVYQKAIELQPNLWEVYHNLGDIWQGQGRFNEAVAAYRLAIELNPDFCWSHNNLGDVLIKQEKWEEAVEGYRSAIGLNPDFHWSHYNLADACVKLERWEEAVVAYRSAISLQDNLPGIHQKLADALWWQFKSYKKEILSICCQAIQADPDDIQNYYKLLEVYPNHVELYLELGDKLMLNNKSSGAIAVYQVAIQYNPDNASLYSKIAEILFTQRHYEDAILNFQRSVEIEPKASTFYLLGLSLEKKQNIDKAINAYHQAIQLEQNYFYAHLRLGLVLLVKKHWDESLTTLERALQLNSDGAEIPELYAGLGRAFLEKENFHKAIQYCEKSLTLQPDEWQVLRYMGDALRKQGQREAAVKTYQYAITLKPDFPWIHNSLADTLREMEYWEEAERSYYRFFELVPEHYWANYHLALVLTKQKKWDKVVIRYRKALKINPDSLEIQQKLEEILRLHHQQLSEAAKGYFERGNQLKKESELDLAIACYHQAIEVQPEMADAYHELAILLQQRGQFDEAVYWRIKSIEACPTYKESYYRLMWTKFENTKLLEEATVCCQMILEKYHELLANDQDEILLALVYSTLGDLLTRQKRITEASVAYKKSIYQKALASGQNNSFVKNEWRLEEKSKGPDFFIIGGMRCGSTSLHHYISYHSQIITPVKKEIHFFGENYVNGIDWYLSHFPPIPEKKGILTGEASPCFAEYGISNQVFQCFPNLKLIVILRNPVDRAYSHYNHTISWHSEYHEFEAAIAADLEENSQKELLLNGDNSYLKVDSDYLRMSLYFYWMKEWLQLFPKEQILVLRSEDLYANPALETQKVFDFLELPKCNNIDSFLHTNKGDYNVLDSSLRTKLKNYFQPHNQKLENLLDMKFDWE
jgi:tetratricopeptide (TPR) repeat protein